MERPCSRVARAPTRSFPVSGSSQAELAEDNTVACQTWIEGTFTREFTQSPAGPLVVVPTGGDDGRQRLRKVAAATTAFPTAAVIVPGADPRATS